MPINISILGLNAIGGALGLALGTLDKEALPTGRPVITGWDADKRTLSDARGRLMIDRDVRELTEAVQGADIVFVCTPLGELAATLSAILPQLKEGTIVADVLSTKQPALATADRVLPDSINFIGSHPLVRPTHADLRGATLDLFKGAIFCLIPRRDTHPRAVDVMAELVTAIGAKPYYMDAAEHDLYEAGAEQLPVLFSATLMDTLSRSGGWREMQPIAGPALRTVAQYATTDPASTSAASAANDVALQRWLNELIAALAHVRDNLANREEIEALLSRAGAAYEQWSAAKPNMRPGEEEFYGQAEEAQRGGFSALLFGQRRKKPDQRK